MVVYGQPLDCAYQDLNHPGELDVSVEWWMILAPTLLVSDVALFWLGYRHCRQRLLRQRDQLPSKDIVEAQLRSLNNVIGALGGCLGTIEDNMTVKRIDPVEATNPSLAHLNLGQRGAVAQDSDGGSERYRIANRLAKRGAAVESLVVDCGLSRGEAETIANLQAGGVSYTA